jgi:L-ribulose-5-phosphate 3-epimerase
MLPPEESFLDRFKLARDAGFEVVELFPVSSRAEEAEIKLAASQAGIGIGSVASGRFNWDYPLTSEDPALIQKGIEGQKLSLRNAANWGAEAILLIAGGVDAATAYGEAWTRSHANIRRLIPTAQTLRVTIAIEEVGAQTKFLLSPLEFARYIAEFHSRWVRAYFDTGNVASFGYPEDWIHTLGRRICKIHLKDYDEKTGKFVNLGEGIVNWPRVRQALTDIGYAGTLTAELAKGDERYLKDVSQRIDRLLLS